MEYGRDLRALDANDIDMEVASLLGTTTSHLYNTCSARNYQGCSGESILLVHKFL